MGTASGTSLVRRANLAVVAHIRHTYTNYDELLRSNMTWIHARRGVEQFTLDKLVSWRGEEDDEDDVMEDVLREVVVISDDEEDDVDAEFMGGAQTNRSSPPENMPTEAIDLTAIDSDDDSDDDITIPYQDLAPRLHGHPDQKSRAARSGQQRHIRWEEAVSRHRTNTGREQPPDARATEVTDQSPNSLPSFGRAGQHVSPKVIAVETVHRPVEFANHVYQPETSNSRRDINAGAVTHVSRLLHFKPVQRALYPAVRNW